MASETFDGVIFEALEQMMACVRRGGHCAALLFDIDHLGSLSDRLGNHVGDRVVETIADVVKEQIEGNGIAGRFGGDSFLVLLRVASDESAMQVAERIRAAVEAAALDRGDGTRVTVSAGVALADHGSNPAELVERADRALHLAKESGRNRIRAWPLHSVSRSTNPERL